MTYDLKNAIQEKIHVINDIILRTQRNEIVDISDLDKEIGVICEKVVALPAREAAEYETLVLDMVSKLEELVMSVQELQQRAGEALEAQNKAEREAEKETKKEKGGSA